MNVVNAGTMTRHLKKLLLPLILLLLVVLIGVLASQRAPMPVIRGDILSDNQRTTKSTSNTIRVCTYNIHSAKGHEEDSSIERVATVLASPPLDLIGLQEVAGDLFGETNQASELAGLLDLGWLYAPTRKKLFSANFGSALLSRYPLTDYEVKPLLWERRDSNGTQTSRSNRNRIKATLLLQEQPVTVIITHLDRGQLRLEQLHDVITEFRHHSPAILMGDLNSHADATPLSELLASGEATDAIAASIANKDSTNRIDWILTRGFKVVDGGIHPRGVSDHPGYWAELQLATP
jgi:endonuclease/exonuclease/phosphatase family metal-dependent hydrolase